MTDLAHSGKIWNIFEILNFVHAFIIKALNIDVNK